MAQLTISLPEPAKEFLEEQVAAGQFADPDKYILHLLDAERKRQARERVEALLREGLESPASEMTAEDWQRLKDRVWEREERRNGPT